MILKLGSSISKCVTLKMTACSRLSITAYFPFDGQMLVNGAANGFAAVMKDSFFLDRIVNTAIYLRYHIKQL